jgi:esterase
MSMGGLNTMTYASTRPPGLEAVTIVDVTPTIHAEGARPIGEFSRSQEFESVDDALEKAIAFNPMRPRAHLHYSLIHALRQRHDGKWVWKHERPEPAQPTPPRPTADRDGYLPTYQALWNEVANINCPALVVHGGDSKIIHREDAERLANVIPNGEVLTIADAGHTVQGDQPVRFVEAVVDFLGRHGL